ncbi:MAG: hypothetical protein ABWX57_02085 [Aeromicrobium sp.]
MTQKLLHLNAFLMEAGHHEASWRLPDTDPGAALDVQHYGLSRPVNRFEVEVAGV